MRGREAQKGYRKGRGESAEGIREAGGEDVEGDQTP